MGIDYSQVIKEVNEVAFLAGAEWLANARPKYVVEGYEDSPMLDLCGNAHIRVKDARTKFGRYIKSISDKHGALTVPLTSEFRYRQEHGLQMAMVKAGIKLLKEKYDITDVYNWNYIDQELMMEIDQDMKERIDKMPLYDMLYNQRFAPIGDPLFTGNVGLYFAEVMQAKRNAAPNGEWTRISKMIGWQKSNKL